MAERIDVMISSTARDLPHYRQQAMEACVRQGMFPIMMEHLPAMDEDAISASLAMVDEAELYLGIFAHRYGYVPQGYDLSITEMEYNRAVERGIPRLIFIIEEGFGDDLPHEQDEAAAARLKQLKERLKTEQVVNFFTTPADLRAQIINSLARFYTRQISTLHRQSLIPTPPTPYIAHPYTLLESERLFGRTAELKLLSDWITGRSSSLGRARVLNVVAMGGMGKSSLAWKWFNELAPKLVPLEGRLWWSFYESDAHYENFITRALAYVSGQSEETGRQMSMARREEQLLGILDQKPFLLVLDGLERILVAYARPDAVREVETKVEATVGGLLGLPTAAGTTHRLRKASDPRAGAFLRKLSNLNATRVLVSTRLYPAELETPAGTELPGSAALNLTGLDDDSAISLWRSFGVSGMQDALLELFHAFDNYPLLIRALAGEVARYRRAPCDFDQWRSANPDFSPFRLPIVQRQSHVLQFALSGLEATELYLLQTLAAFKSPATYSSLVDLLVEQEALTTQAEQGARAAPFPNEDALDKALTELEDRGLLGWDRVANRYDMHPVVRGIIWSSTPPETKRKIYEKRRSHFAAMPIIKDWRAIKKSEDLSASRELYYTLIGLECYDEACEVLSNRLYRPLRYRFSDGQMLATLLEMLFPDDDPMPRLSKPASQTWALNALAQAYQMIGQPGRAVPLFERSNQLKEAASYSVDLSMGLRDLSYAQRLVGNLHEAETAARRALYLDRSDGNQLLEAISLQVLGLALAARGKFDESAQALDRSLDLADRTNANRAYNHQAMRALWFGDHSAALDWAEKAITYSRQRRLEAAGILALRLHGEAALGLRDLKLAEERLSQAIAQARAVNFMEEEIAGLIALAEVRRQQGRYDAARELLAEVWQPLEDAPYRLFHADACNVLAQIEREVQNQEAAAAAAAKAYERAWCDGPPYAYYAGLRQAKIHLAVLGAPEPQLPPFDLQATATMPMVFVEITPPNEE